MNSVLIIPPINLCLRSILHNLTVVRDGEDMGWWNNHTREATCRDSCQHKTIQSRSAIVENKHWTFLYVDQNNTYITYTLNESKNLLRSSIMHHALWGYTAQMACWSGSSWPCPPSYWTLEDSLNGCLSPLQWQFEEKM